uniref:Uncharacterized protein n=1 Tax=Hyaloperonospora arabidopsidis (strain Emoy2) TaxID=559515 RepID=M4BTJ9_HYAAE
MRTSFALSWFGLSFDYSYTGTVNANNLADSGHKRLSASSPRSSPRSGSTLSITISSPNSRGFGSGHSTPTSDYKSGDSFHLDRPKARSISEDGLNQSESLQPKMDSNIQLKLNRLLESVYAAAKTYIERQSENGNLLRKQTMQATWKKKGMLLKQGFIYKNTWESKPFFRFKKTS